jgi:hypothetical protein
VAATELGSVANTALDDLRQKVNADVDFWTGTRLRCGTDLPGIPSRVSTWALQKTVDTAFADTIKRVEAIPDELGYADGDGSHLQFESLILGQGNDQRYGMMLSVTSVIDGTVRSRSREGEGTCTDRKQILNPFTSPSKSITTWIKPDEKEPGRWRAEIDGKDV